MSSTPPPLPPAGPPPLPRERVLPRIRNTAWLAEVAQHAGDGDQARLPVNEPLVGDLLLIYGLDEGSRYRMLTAGDLHSRGLARSELRELAANNLRATLREVRRRWLVEGVLMELADDDDMLVCTLLVPEFWRAFIDAAGGPIVATFPLAGSGFLARADDEGIAALQAHLAAMDSSEQARLTELLYECRDGEWRVHGT